MVEVLLFIIVLIILIPVIIFVAAVYNIQRSLKGNKPLTLEESIAEAFKNTMKSTRNVINQIFNIQSSGKKVEKSNSTKLEFEDAEFREIENNKAN